jgi:hypothetical protein
LQISSGPHTLPQAPQFRLSVFSGASQPFAGFASQSPKLGSHVLPHVPAAQFGCPCGAGGQTVQAAPHAAGSVSCAHFGPHAWKPALHVKPQRPAAQVVVAFATSGHFAAQPPQCVVLVSGSTHSAPHRSGVAAEQPFVHAKLAPLAWQFGAAAGQGALHAPQVAGFERSVSQPSAGSELQSAQPGSHVFVAQAPAAQVVVAWVSRQGVQLVAVQP